MKELTKKIEVEIPIIQCEHCGEEYQSRGIIIDSGLLRLGKDDFTKCEVCGKEGCIKCILISNHDGTRHDIHIDCINKFKIPMNR